MLLEFSSHIVEHVCGGRLLRFHLLEEKRCFLALGRLFFFEIGHEVLKFYGTCGTLVFGGRWLLTISLRRLSNGHYWPLGCLLAQELIDFLEVHIVTNDFYSVL